MENVQSLSEYLRYMRKLRGYRQKDIASWLQISRQTYSHYETGRIKPSAAVLYKLAQIYDVSVDSILKRSEMIETDSIKVGIKSLDENRKDQSFSEQQFFSCLYGLNEKNRRDVFSIMWEIVLAKKKQEETDLRETGKGRV